MLQKDKRLTANYLFVSWVKLQVTDTALSHEFQNYDLKSFSSALCVFEIFPVSSVYDWNRTLHLSHGSSFSDLTNFCPAKSLAASALPSTCMCLGHLSSSKLFILGFSFRPISIVLTFSDTTAMVILIIAALYQQQSLNRYVQVVPWGEIKVTSAIKAYIDTWNITD